MSFIRLPPEYRRFLLFYIFLVFIPSILLSVVGFFLIMFLLSLVFSPTGGGLEVLVYLSYTFTISFWLSILLIHFMCSRVLIPRFFVDVARIRRLLFAHSFVVFVAAPVLILSINSAVSSLEYGVFSRESARYRNAVNLSNFQDQLVYNLAKGHPRLQISATANVKEEGMYTFSPSLFCRADCQLEYERSVNGETLQNGFVTVFLPSGSSEMMFEFIFDEINFGRQYAPHEEYKSRDFRFGYSITKPGRIGKPGILSQLNIKPEYEDWNYVVVPSGKWTTRSYTEDELKVETQP